MIFRFRTFEINFQIILSRWRLPTFWCWSWWRSTLGYVWPSFSARRPDTFSSVGGSPSSSTSAVTTATDHDCCDGSEDFANIVSNGESRVDLQFDDYTYSFCCSSVPLQFTFPLKCFWTRNTHLMNDELPECEWEMCIEQKTQSHC